MKTSNEDRATAPAKSTHSDVRSKSRRFRLMSALVAITFFMQCLPPFSPQSLAEDFSTNYGFKFNRGIGFYVVIDGIAYPLGFPRPVDKTATDAQVMLLPYDAQFYAYGLDFAGGGLGAPAPPHILGYGLSYLDVRGERQGRWAARFVPVSGYDDKVYRIIFDGPYDRLRNEEIRYRFWAFELPGDREGFLFRFATEMFQEQRKKLRAIVSQAFSGEKWLSGTLTPFTPLPGLEHTPTQFKIRFSNYDEAAGTVKAEAADLKQIFRQKERVGFDGQFEGVNRRLTLTEPESKTVWYLELTDERRLIGVVGSLLRKFQVEIPLDTAPLD